MNSRKNSLKTESHFFCVALDIFLILLFLVTWYQWRTQPLCLSCTWHSCPPAEVNRNTECTWFSQMAWRSLGFNIVMYRVIHERLQMKISLGICNPKYKKPLELDILFNSKYVSNPSSLANKINHDTFSLLRLWAKVNTGCNGNHFFQIGNFV
jgi:hypothetical protein